MSIKTKQTIIAAALCLLPCLNASAQEDGFDLNTQRSEKQDVVRIPGKKIDHKGIVVSPTPQEATFGQSATVSIGGGFALKDKQKAFGGDIDFIPQSAKGTRLTVDFGEKKAAKQGVKAVSGAYSLTIDGKGVSIVGFDERGAFYGLQTLRQLIESPVASGGQLPYAQINDWPDLPNRGVVEGFYGNPWSHKVRLSLIDFYGKFKMNTYLYGPKDDPYHSSPNWRLPYPEKEANDIAELIEACRRNRVDFVWAIHPGKDIKWNEDDYQNLVGKFNIMYGLGVRHFAIFFDDIEGEGTNPMKQTELLNRLTDDFVKAKGDVSSLTVCPTDYSRLWANPTENGSLAIYGRTLYPDIKVFYTGDVVCSDLTRESLDFMNTRIKRPAYYWWNFPVTDYARNYILQGPTYGLDTSLTSSDLCGIVSNPMEHGEASKLALYGVADYAWNISDYNAIDNWERGLAELVPGATEAYRTFAIHSCDTESGYRRDESWETRTFSLANWDDNKATALEKEYAKLESVPAEMESGCANKALFAELRPWLTEAGKLGHRGRMAMQLGRDYRTGVADKAAFWDKLVGNMMTDDDQKQYTAHKLGSMKLQPFYESVMDEMAHGFMQSVLNAMPRDYRGIGSFPNSATTQTKLMLDNDTTTYYSSAMGQRPGSWIGLDLRAVRAVHEVSIMQGRNSTDDTDFFDHATLECSADGQTWTPLIAELAGQYKIHWTGDTVMARYVRLRRLDSERKNYATIRSFEVNPMAIESLGFGLQTTGNVSEPLYMFDENASTACLLDGSVTIDVPEGTKEYVIMTGHSATPPMLTLIGGNGDTVASSPLKDTFATITLADYGVSKLRISGRVSVYEIIRR